MIRAYINHNYKQNDELIHSIQKYKLQSGQSGQSKQQRFSENVKNSSTNKVLQYDITDKKRVAGREEKYSQDIYEQMIKYKLYLNFIKTKDKNILNLHYESKYYTNFDTSKTLIENIFTEYNENQEKKRKNSRRCIKYFK